MKIFCRIAMAVIAASALFTSCVLFDPEPTLDAGYAEFDVTVKTTFGDVVTNDAVVSIVSNNLGDNKLLYSSGIAVVVGNENGNKTVNNQTLSFSATYKGYSATDYRTINTVLPGSSYKGSIILVLGPAVDYYVKLDKTSDVVSTYSYLAKATFPHSDPSLKRNVLLMENATEYLLTRTEQVLERTGYDVVDYDSLTPQIVKDKAAPYRGDIKDETITHSLVVSAWSIYGLERDIQQFINTYGVYQTGFDTKVGEFDVINYSTAVNYLEYPHPSHKAHYTHGHGTHIGYGHTYDHGHSAHGAADNAGGGIVEPL